MTGREKLAAGLADARADLRHELTIITQVVRAEKLRQVADEFDSIHDIQRARRVGSVDHIIAAAELRPFIIGALERWASADTSATACTSARRSGNTGRSDTRQLGQCRQSYASGRAASYARETARPAERFPPAPPAAGVALMSRQ